MFAGRNMMFAGGFNPLSLSPALWYSDTGSDPSVWPDISGNARHATQATTARQMPIVTNAINGKQIRRGNGSTTPGAGTFFDHPWDETSSFTFICVIDDANVSDFRQIFGAKISGSVTLVYASTGNQAITFNSAGTPVSSNQSLTTSPIVLTFIKSGSTISFFKNGTAGTSYLGFTPYGGDSNLRRTIGGYNNPIVEASIGADLAEIMVLPYDASTTQRQAAERFLGVKYGITVA